MKRRSFLAAVMAFAMPFSLTTGAGADCGAPELSVTPAQVPVGDEIRITGEYWNDVCNDTSTSVGCWDAPEEDDQPTQNIELVLVNRDTKARHPVGVVDANDDLRFTFTTVVDVPPGWYVIKDARGESYVSNATRFRVVGAGFDG